MHISSRDTSYESNNFVVADDKTKLAMENDNSENNLIGGRTMKQWSIIPWSLISSASLCAFWYVFLLNKRQLLQNAKIQYYFFNHNISGDFVCGFSIKP